MTKLWKSGQAEGKKLTEAYDAACAFGKPTRNFTIKMLLTPAAARPILSCELIGAGTG
jgi:hypothetical protein